MLDLMKTLWQLVDEGHDLDTIRMALTVLENDLAIRAADTDEENDEE